jgi:hypothetical protein
MDYFEPKFDGYQVIKDFVLEDWIQLGIFLRKNMFKLVSCKM